MRDDTTTLIGATLPDGRIRNVVLQGGNVKQVRPVGMPDPAGSTLDLTGYVLLPAPAEPHIHLDRALTWQPVEDGVRFDGSVQAWRAWPARYGTHDLRRRARAALNTLAAHGTTAVRTHIDVDGTSATLRAVEGMRELREEFSRTLDLQIVAVADPGLPERAVLDAVNAGADLLGGSPGRAADVRAETRALLRLADRAEVGLDLHLDDQPDPRILAVADLARLLRASGFSQPVTASHVSGLGLLRGPALTRVTELISAAGMSVVGLPSTQLRLHGPNWPAGPRQQGVPLPMRALLAAGIKVAAGGDHLRDSMNPMGRADALETASLLVTSAGLTAEQAYTAVSTNARLAMGLPEAGLEPGQRADLLAVRAATLAEAIAAAPEDRLVLRRGRLVSRTTVSRTGPLHRSSTRRTPSLRRPVLTRRRAPATTAG